MMLLFSEEELGMRSEVVNNKGERRITPVGCESLSNRQVLSKACK
jgi:hypothetical protein